MDKIVITKEMLDTAGDYMPLAAKEAWVAENAPKCFDRLAITADGEAMPPMYMVNEGLKKRYLMTVLVSAYLHRPYDVDDSDEALMSEAEYDKWAGSHVFCQIDRWKSEWSVRDKCYDLLYDYRDLEKRFSAQIGGLLAVQNDFVLRQSQYMTNSMKELPDLIGQLKELQGKGEANGAS